MEDNIRVLALKYISNFDKLYKDATDDKGNIKEEYQNKIIELYQDIYLDVINELIETDKNVTGNILRLQELIFVFHVLDEHIYNNLNTLMKQISLWKHEAQVRLYMMYLKTLREVLYLLCGGYSDCAFARTRKLFELGVYINIINQNDNILAERFCKHSSNKQSLDLAYSMNDREKVKRIRSAICWNQYLLKVQYQKVTNIIVAKKD